MTSLSRLKDLRLELTRFMMAYRFGLNEMLTKVRILQEEFAVAHDYNPIEHVSSRIKTPESIVRKAMRRRCPLTTDDLRARMFDIAGIRIVCKIGRAHV